jgi:hypothetical protein
MSLAYASHRGVVVTQENERGNALAIRALHREAGMRLPTMARAALLPLTVDIGTMTTTVCRQRYYQEATKRFRNSVSVSGKTALRSPQLLETSKHNEGTVGAVAKIICSRNNKAN